MSRPSSRLLIRLLPVALAGFAFAPPLRATPPRIMTTASDSVQVDGAWARASAGAATTGAAYVTLMGGMQPDALVGVSTPVAAMAEVHETSNDNGVMKMRPVEAVPISPHQMVTFKPGGYHIMLTGLKHPLAAGQSFPVTLTFAHAVSVTVEVQVRAIGQAAASSMSGHDGMPMR